MDKNAIMAARNYVAMKGALRKRFSIYAVLFIICTTVFAIVGISMDCFAKWNALYYGAAFAIFMYMPARISFRATLSASGRFFLTITILLVFVFGSVYLIGLPEAFPGIALVGSAFLDVIIGFVRLYQARNEFISSGASKETLRWEQQRYDERQAELQLIKDEIDSEDYF